MVGTTALNLKPQSFVTDTSGHIAVTYKTPSSPPTNGEDLITAQNLASHPTIRASDHYTFDSVKRYKMSPHPIAATASLGANASVIVTLTALNSSDGGVQWASMQKSIYSLPALRELLAASNRRYLEFLSAIEDPRAGRDRLDKLSQPVELEGRRYSGFNLFDPDDENLLCSIVRGEFNISGLQNKTLRRHAPELSSAQMSRALKRLRTHGLIKKIGHTYKYYVTSFGKQAVTTALKLRELVIIPELAIGVAQ